jgi:thiol:disulfide interchange protein DsbD
MRRLWLIAWVTALAALVLVLLGTDIAWAAGSEAEEFKRDLESRGFLLMLLSSLGLGIAASLTPCVYPMIPIVVGVFGARDEAVTRRRAFGLATAYVLGMGVIYTVLGILFAMLGKAGDQGQVLANPWIVIPLVGVYALLASSMFGAFELNLPPALQQRLARVGGKGYGGAFGMGLVGGFTAAPCTGPFLAGMLGWVAMTGSVVRGASMLFTFALGMGVLFWVIAATSVSLPKSGRWMEWVKSAGGIALLVGIYFLRPIVPALAELGSASMLFLALSVAIAVAGLALGAVHKSFHGGAGERVRKGIGVTLAVVGATGVLTWLATPDRTLPWRTDETVAFAEAKAQGKGVMIDFSADYCKPCKKLETDTFSADGVFEKIVADYVPLKFDVSKGTDLDDERQEKYDAEGALPAVLLLDASGRELARIREFIGPDEFMKVLRWAEKARAGEDKTASTP